MTKTISVYFDGSDDKYDSIYKESVCVTLPVLLNAITKQAGEDESFYFNGKELEAGIHKIIYILQKCYAKNDISKVNLNICGFGLGGLAGFMLCHRLKSIPQDRLSISVAAFDPLPGQFDFARCRDLLFQTKSTLSPALADLSDCHNVSQLKVLFSKKAAIQSVMSRIFLPSSCHATIDVTPEVAGRANVFFKHGQSINANHDEDYIAFYRFTAFLQNANTTFDFSKFNLSHFIYYDLNQFSARAFDGAEEALKKLYSRLLDHGVFCDNSKVINPYALYLNLHHQELASHEEPCVDDCRLFVENLSRHVNKLKG